MVPNKRETTSLVINWRL